MSIDNTYLHTLNKDELIELLLLVNSETMKDKKQIIRDEIQKSGYNTNAYGHKYKWIAVCDIDTCNTLIGLDGGGSNYGISCEQCEASYCYECESKYEVYDVCQTCGKYWCTKCQNIKGIVYHNEDIVACIHCK